MCCVYRGYQRRYRDADATVWYAPCHVHSCVVFSSFYLTDASSTLSVRNTRKRGCCFALRPLPAANSLVLQVHDRFVLYIAGLGKHLATSSAAATCAHTNSCD